MRTIYPTGSKGFTLLEILVAVVVFTLGFSGIFSIFLSSAAALRHVGNRMEAIVFMEKAVDEFAEDPGKIAVGGEYSYEKTETNGSRDFNITAKAVKVRGYQKLYKLESEALWSEGRKTVSLKRERMIRML
jgi:prepilin-type N-terminal cleavage/methylation domain-containing protein